MYDPSSNVAFLNHGGDGAWTHTRKYAEPVTSLPSIVLCACHEVGKYHSPFLIRLGLCDFHTDIALFHGVILRSNLPCSVSRINQNSSSLGFSPIENSFSVWDATTPPLEYGHLVVLRNTESPFFQNKWFNQFLPIILPCSYHAIHCYAAIFVEPGLPTGFHGWPFTSTKGLSLVDHRTINCFPAGLPPSSSNITNHHHQSQVK